MQAHNVIIIVNMSWAHSWDAGRSPRDDMLVSVT